jgi:hypothetical protein
MDRSPHQRHGKSGLEPAPGTPGGGSKRLSILSLNNNTTPNKNNRLSMQGLVAVPVNLVVTSALRTATKTKDTSVLHLKMLASTKCHEVFLFLLYFALR